VISDQRRILSSDAVRYSTFNSIQSNAFSFICLFFDCRAQNTVSFIEAVYERLRALFDKRKNGVDAKEIRQLVSDTRQG
jgi:hypothetical protein